MANDQKEVLGAKDVPDTRFLSSKEKFNLLLPERRIQLLKQMGDEDAAKLNYDWEFNGRPKQLSPDHEKSRATSFCMCKYLEAQSQTDKQLKLEQFPSCTGRTTVEVVTNLDTGKQEIVHHEEPRLCEFRKNWSVWVLLAGRGFGKTRVGAELVRDMVESGQAKRIHIIAPTAADARDVAVEGESGLLNISPPWNKPLYESTKRRLTWPNGAVASLFSAEEPERLRGPQCLVGSTLVSTPSGDICIDLLKPGMLINTPTGPKKVINQWLAGENEQVFTLHGQTGKLTGTAEHKIYSDGKFVNLIDMEGRICVILQSSSNTTEKDTFAEKTDIINGGMKNSPTQFGKITGKKYQKVAKYIIKTAIKPVSRLKILSVLQKKNITHDIRPNDQKISNSDGKQVSFKQRLAYSVKKSLSIVDQLKIMPRQSFALSLALRLGETRDLYYNETAKSVKSSSLQNDLTKNTAQRNVIVKRVVLEDLNLIKSKVVSVVPSGTSKVYDITVEGGVFYANGILVHNCDFAWTDELAAWDPNVQQMVWDMMNFGLRLGKNPRAVVTTTPKPTVLIQNLVKQAKDPINRTIITTGSTYENRSNLAAPFMRQITQYEGTNLGRQEIYAELIDIEESGILKRSWFKRWAANKPMPHIEYVLQSYDTAFTAQTENDPTGQLAFGVFRPSPDEPYCVMLLDAWTDHLKYPELRKKATEEYRNTYGPQEANVDILLIEDKGSGIALIQDLQRAGLPVRKYNPGRPDKIMRLHAVSHLVYNGRVYIPESKKVPGEFITWAEDFIREVCSFPNSPHDEYVDCLSQALAFFRDQEWINVDPEPVKDPFEEEDNWQDEVKFSNPYAA